MKTTNKIASIFGPAGSFAGIIISLAGIALLLFSLAAVILIIFGALIAFSSVKTQIDKNNHRIRYFQSYFGFINMGKWVTIDPSMKMGVNKFQNVSTVYSRSNRRLDIKSEDYLILLYTADNQVLMPVMKTKNIEIAKKEAKKLNEEFCLGLSE